MTIASLMETLIIKLKKEHREEYAEEEDTIKSKDC
jgi:hypothetical protein